MSWKSRLRPASFRGAPFFVASVGGSGGRRLAFHEYPGRDEPYVEDLGRKGARYRVTAYVLGANYEQSRDALLRACNEAGAGTLVHPTWGDIIVACESVDFEETKEEGGICRFSLSFLEAGRNAYPQEQPDTVAIVNLQAAAAGEAFAAAFDRLFTLTGLPGFVGATAAGRLTDLASLVAGLPLGPSAGVAGLLAARSTLMRLADALAREPLRLLASGGAALSIAGLLAGARRASASPRAAIEALDDVRAFASHETLPLPSTPSRKAVVANAAALNALVDRAALAEQARAVTALDFVSYDDAAEMRTKLCGDMAIASDLAADSGDATSWRALRSLSAAVSADLTARGGSLARLAPYRLPVSLPSVVLAHRFYGNAGRADELVARNKARHPLFMPPGGEMLSN